jgi:hypothetical protein
MIHFVSIAFTVSVWSQPSLTILLSLGTIAINLWSLNTTIMTWRQEISSSDVHWASVHRTVIIVSSPKSIPWPAAFPSVFLPIDASV